MASVAFETPFSFSENGKYFAFCGNDGKLKVWDSATGVLKQEYTKNLHLSSPCSSLIWVHVPKTIKTPQKRKSSGASVLDTQEVVAIGTTSGSVVLYSVDSNSLISESAAGHTDKVNHLAVHQGSLFSCSDDRYIVHWNISKHENNIKSKWKSGKDKIKCILVLSCGKRLVSSSCSIKLWNIEKKEILTTYTGHASEVFILREIPGRDLFVSAAKGDRIVSVWSSTESPDSNAVGSYLLQDSAASLSVCDQCESPTAPLMTVVSESGVMHVFDQRIKGPIKATKPTKPKLNVTVASEGEGVKTASVPLPIHAALFTSKGANILIAYGSPVFLHFENIVLAEHKEEHVVLVRSNKKRIAADEFNSRTRVPETQGDVEYMKGGTAAATLTSFRKQRDVPLEQRLENLALVPGEGPPKKDNMANLLIQGLQSRDRDLIQDVLFRGEDSVINSTVSNVPIQALPPLLRELTALVQGKTFTNRVAVRWLNAIVRTHAAIILANPELQKLMAPLAAAIEAKMEGLSGLLKLYGRLNLVAQQMTSEIAEDELGEPLVTYQERDESESDSDSAPESEEPEEWDEFSDMDEDADGDAE